MRRTRRGMMMAVAPWLVLATAALAGPAPSPPPPAPLHLRVSNTLALARRDAVLSLPMAEIWRRRPQWRSRALVASVAGTSALLPVQRYASHGGDTPDRLLVRLDMPARGSRMVDIFPRPAEAKAAPNPLYARLVPERYDDFAWENEQVTFRIYGKALEATGQVFSGIDVWSKRPPRQVIDAWYRRDAEGLRLHRPALSYHIDHGDGLDSYAVGHTPGDGGTAAWLRGRPVYSRNATRVRVTAMGPVRLRFEVDYAPWRAGRVLIHEHKVVTLDAGSHLNRQAVTYRIEGAPRLTMAAGVATHAGARLAHAGATCIAVWDTPQRASAGHIATALLPAPRQAARYAVAGGAAWALFEVADGDTIRFASGAGWSQGDMPSFQAWRHYLADYRRRWAHPLRVRWPAVPRPRADDRP